MKAKEIQKTVVQLAAETIAEKNIKIFWNDRGTVGIEWDDKNYNSEMRELEDVRKVITEADWISVEVFRGDRGWRIDYFVKIHISYRYRQGGKEYEYFATTYTAEKAFAIKDLLEDMIEAFKSRKDGESV